MNPRKGDCTMNPRKGDCTEIFRQPKRPNTKSSSVHDEDDEDRISSLPDHLLLQIISLLEMHQAVSTGILSKRWRDLWTFTPNLHFSESKSSCSRCCYFIMFVEQSLSLHIGVNIHKFSLQFPYCHEHCQYVDGWLHLAVMKGVRELCLQFSGRQNGLHKMNRYMLPSWLFECEKLVSLELYSCKVEVPDDVCFSSLRVLSLIQIELNGKAIDKLLAGSPLLENLTIISSIMALKQENGCGDVKSLPENLRRANVLTLCCRSMRMVSISQLQNLHSYVSKTKCLSLITSLHKEELPGIANLLRISNELETLIIRLDAVHHKYKGKDYWELLTYGFPSLAHLKTIKIIGFMLYVQYFYDNKYPTCFIESLDGKMNLIRVLLKNATMLQKMIIHLPRKHRSRNIGVGAMGLWLKIKRLVSEKLTAIPGVSSSAQVLFSDY